MTFEENLKFKRDIPLTAYIDFETTVPTDDCLDPESKKMNAVSYVIIFAFHPDLDLKRVIIERSFGHSLEKLTTIDYLTTEQLKYKDLTTLKQLRDCAISVASKQNKIAISEMFSTELKFASDCLINWFNLKFKKQNLEVSNEKRRAFEIENQIDWKNDNCKICNFPLHINPTTFDVEKEKMSYGDFIIKKEHKFLRNIFSKEELMSSDAIKNLQSFHGNFSKFLQVVVYLQNSIKLIKDFSECFHDELIKFCNEFCDDCRENKDVIPCIAHNFFNFDMIFLLKTVRLSAWRTKDIHIGGKNLTDLNYASIDKFKFIDTMKYYQSSLGKLSETLTEKEKNNITKLTVKFLVNHDYFLIVWDQMLFDQKNKVIEITISGKGVIPYEKIEKIDLLSIKSEDGIFFSKDEFFSTLKGKNVDDESYENAKNLFILLKMRNLSDLNDLYNAQDVIILLEIIENRFQSMQDKTGYNPRIINSASKLSSCIQREQSKCILALPINNTQMEIFEKTLSGGLSSVNTRLSFDTELLMPNLTQNDYQKMSIDQSFKAFKRFNETTSMVLR